MVAEGQEWVLNLKEPSLEPGEEGLSPPSPLIALAHPRLQEARRGDHASAIQPGGGSEGFPSGWIQSAPGLQAAFSVQCRALYSPPASVSWVLRRVWVGLLTVQGPAAQRGFRLTSLVGQA